MKISFDLDGVVTDGSGWFFSLCEAVGNHNESVKAARLRYYDSCKLKHNPQLFLSRLDEGFIITSRKSESKIITRDWLRRHGILIPVFHIEGADHIDWANYPQASIEAAKQKVKLIRHLDINVHFDNNPYIVEELRRLTQLAFIIQVS